MKALLLLFVVSALASCNTEEALKETSDAIDTSVKNIGEAIKETPGAISEASNKFEADVKE